MSKLTQRVVAIAELVSGRNETKLDESSQSKRIRLARLREAPERQPAKRMRLKSPHISRTRACKGARVLPSLSQPKHWVQPSEDRSRPSYWSKPATKRLGALTLRQLVLKHISRSPPLVARSWPLLSVLQVVTEVETRVAGAAQVEPSRTLLSRQLLVATICASSAAMRDSRPAILSTAGCISPTVAESSSNAVLRTASVICDSRTVMRPVRLSTDALWSSVETVMPARLVMRPSSRPISVSTVSVEALVCCIVCKVPTEPSSAEMRVPWAVLAVSRVSTRMLRASTLAETELTSSATSVSLSRSEPCDVMVDACALIAAS
eukprot:m.144568 g.144568  ORF g.144568 m.144568 type:complete len:321 (+) comp10065_c0_seq3:694-1656(+)